MLPCSISDRTPCCSSLLVLCLGFHLLPKTNGPVNEYPKRRLLTQEKLAQVRARISKSRFFKRRHNREGKQIYKAHSSDFFEN